MIPGDRGPGGVVDRAVRRVGNERAEPRLGPGLDPETAHRIFEPFFSTKRDGMGLGLAISRSLIEAQGGELWVETERAPGTEFHFTLPLAHD